MPSLSAANEADASTKSPPVHRANVELVARDDALLERGERRRRVDEAAPLESPPRQDDVDLDLVLCGHRDGSLDDGRWMFKYGRTNPLSAQSRSWTPPIDLGRSRPMSGSFGSRELGALRLRCGAWSRRTAALRSCGVWWSRRATWWPRATR